MGPEFSPVVLRLLCDHGDTAPIVLFIGDCFFFSRAGVSVVVGSSLSIVLIMKLILWVFWFLFL